MLVWEVLVEAGGLVSTGTCRANTADLRVGLTSRRIARSQAKKSGVWARLSPTFEIDSGRDGNGALTPERADELGQAGQVSV